MRTTIVRDYKHDDITANSRKQSTQLYICSVHQLINQSIS